MQEFRSENLRRAFRVIQECVSMGVEEFCFCAGSRNSPFAAILAASDLRTHSFSDERVASFFALGRSMRTGKGVAVLSSSGTAVAELLPATIEACYQSRPLVLITADRPHAFRGSGAPQSMDQSSLLKEHCQYVWDIDANGEVPQLSDYRFSRPIHINIAFDEPLLSKNETPEQLSFSTSPWSVSEGFPASDLEQIKHFCEQGPLLVLLSSLEPFERKACADFLHDLGAPIWAEANSCLREEPALQSLLIKSGEALLERFPWQAVLRIGGVPSCRFWRNLEKKDDLKVLNLSRVPLSGLSRESTTLHLDIRDLEGCRPKHVHDYEKLFHLDEIYRKQLRLLMSELPRSEVSLLSFLSQRISDSSDVYLGNSLVIREWNLGARYHVSQKRYFSNRGMNGIDGQVSTFLGACSENKHLCWGVFGDHTSLYDLNSMACLSCYPKQKYGIVVVNNGGGQIFSRVKDLSALWETSERARSLFECPQNVQFSAWAKMWGLDYLRVSDADEFRVPDESFVMELKPDPTESAEFWKRFDSIWKAL